MRGLAGDLHDLAQPDREPRNYVDQVRALRPTRRIPRNVPPAALRPVEGEIVACGPYCAGGYHSITCDHLNGRRA